MFIVVLATILGISAPAKAISFTTFTDRASWEAAVGRSFREETFNSYTVDTFFAGFFLVELLINFNGGLSTDSFSLDNVVYFNSSASVPFEFSPTLGLLAVGGFWSVSRLRKKMTASKITE